MIVFVTALNAEARLFTSVLGLKQQWHVQNQRFYAKGGFGLITTGTGKVASATGVVRVLERVPDVTLLMNIGLCGTKSQNVSPYTLFSVRSIRDHSSGKRFFPDIIFRHSLPESNLETWDHPVTGEYHDEVHAELVDMEAAGFYEAASQQLESHQIQCLKLVSDHLDPRPVNAVKIMHMFQDHMEKILTFADQAAKPVTTYQNIPDDQDVAELEDLFNRWRCTSTQRHLLRQSLGYARLRDGTRLSDITLFHRHSAHSRQRDQLVDEIRKKLTEG